MVRIYDNYELCFYELIPVFTRELKRYYLKTNMMSHRTDFENHKCSFKIHFKPIYSVCYACSGLASAAEPLILSFNVSVC